MTDNAPAPFVLQRGHLSGASLTIVGAKATTLGRMAQAGVPVPDFYVVSSAAFASHLAANGIVWPESPEALADTARLTALRRQIIESPVPEAIRGPVLEAYDALCGASGHGHVAVRSSGGEEDSASASFAGQFMSVLGVAGSDRLLDAVKACWASYVSEASLAYRAARDTPLDQVPSFGVVVQVQVFSEKAGVLFTVHPLEPDRGVSFVEANFGTGESVTGGLATPDAIAVSRAGGEVVERRIATKRRMTTVSHDSGSRVVDVDAARATTPVLTEPETAELVRTGLRVEELLGAPQDIEWAFDPAGLWILQSRPVTGLGWPGVAT